MCTLIISTLLILVAGDFMLGTIIFVRHTLNDIHVNKTDIKNLSGDSRESLPVYDNYLNSGEFWQEHIKTWNTHFEPYYHWRRDGYRGKYTNVSNDGVRRTVTQPSAKDAKKVFMFGGSTLWGTGSKDEHTIPSYLQLMLGENYKVYNFGESGYVAAQELNYLLYQLANGNIPETVIFYDGVNDGYAGVYSPAIPRDVQNLRIKYKNEKRLNALFESYNASNYKKLFTFLFGSKASNKWDDEIASNIKANSSSVTKFYEAHIKQVKALGKEYSFKSFFFWQPNLFSKTRDGLPYEQTIIQQSSPKFVESQHQVYLDAKSTFSSRENEGIYFLGDIFNLIQEPIYIDWCHIGPNGNQIVATQIFNSIVDYLK